MNFLYTLQSRNHQNFFKNFPKSQKYAIIKVKFSGRSAVWLARLVRVQEVGGSNPPGPKGRFSQKENSPFASWKTAEESFSDLTFLPKYAILYISYGGQVPEWPKGADCKSAGTCLRWFESNPAQKSLPVVREAFLLSFMTLLILKKAGLVARFFLPTKDYLSLEII